MIEIKTDEKGADLSFVGGLEVLCNDMINILKAVYACIADNDKEAAEIFRQCMSDTLIDTAFSDEDGVTVEIKEESK